MADTNGLGYEGGALVFAAALVLIMLAYFHTSISRTFLFWSAFIITRPLGATLGDLLDKPINQGGLDLSRYFASATLAAIILACIHHASKGGQASGCAALIMWTAAADQHPRTDQSPSGAFLIYPPANREVWKSGAAERLRVSNGTVSSRSSRTPGIFGGGSKEIAGWFGPLGRCGTPPKSVLQVHAILLTSQGSNCRPFTPNPLK
jgi:hypothetical protein